MYLIIYNFYLGIFDGYQNMYMLYFLDLFIIMIVCLLYINNFGLISFPYSNSFIINLIYEYIGNYDFILYYLYVF